MLLAVDCRCASSTGTHTLAFQREVSEFRLHGRALPHKLTVRNHQACTAPKLLHENWRTWSPQDFHSCFQFHRLLGFSSHSLPVNGSSAFSHSDDAEFSEVEKLPCPNSRHANALFQVLPCIGRAILIFGLGLGLSMPASARMAAPPVSIVSAGDNLMQKDEITMKQEDANGDVAQQKASAFVAEHDGSMASTLNTVDVASNNLDMSDDQLRLSENFWRGIPTPVGSYLYSLKMQLDMSPRDSITLEALLRAVMEQRDMLRALTVLETLLEVQPNDLKWKFLKARTHEYLGELLMAKVEYEELLNLRPLSARFLQGLVMLLNKLGDPAKALELIQKALDSARSENKDVEARNLGVLLSQFHIQLGNFEDALQHLSSMIEQDPDDFRPYLCQGLAYTLMDQKDKAKENFKKYLRLCPPDAFDHDYLDSLMLKARTEKQMDAFMKAAMKGTSRNRKSAKPMKRPSLARNTDPDADDSFL